jgi:hypothetical protein
MGFKISSDGVAFYEHIKNSIDAGSQTVCIRIASVIPTEIVNSCLDNLNALETSSKTSDRAEKLATIKKKALKEIVMDTDFAMASEKVGAKIAI